MTGDHRRPEPLSTLTDALRRTETLTLTPRRAQRRPTTCRRPRRNLGSQHLRRSTSDTPRQSPTRGPGRPAGAHIHKHLVNMREYSPSPQSFYRSKTQIAGIFRITHYQRIPEYSDPPRQPPPELRRFPARSPTPHSHVRPRTPMDRPAAPQTSHDRRITGRTFTRPAREPVSGQSKRGPEARSQLRGLS